MYIFLDLKSQLTKIVASNNFRIAQQASQVKNIFSLFCRINDTFEEIKLALINLELFLE